MLGGGGSILALPIFVYIFGINPILATSYSLFVVGISSLFGTFKCYKTKLIEYKTILTFGLASIISVFLTRKYLIELIPENVNLAFFEVEKGKLILLLFSILMLSAGISLIRSRDKQNNKDVNLGIKSNIEQITKKPTKFKSFILIIQGIIDGVITGIVGAGGGFLIVPILVLINKMDVKLAIGTSLAIISLKTIVGFIGSINQNSNFDYSFLITFTALALFGIFIGLRIGNNVDSEKLKKYFGYFVIICAIFIILKEFL